MLAGDIRLALITAEEVGQAAPSDYSHIAFGCGQDQFERLKETIVEHGGRPWSANKSEGDSFYFLDPDGHQLEIHVGDLASRLAAMKADPWDVIEFFD